MKTLRFTDSQIIAILKQSEASTPEPQADRILNGLLRKA